MNGIAIAQCVALPGVSVYRPDSSGELAAVTEPPPQKEKTCS